MRELLSASRRRQCTGRARAVFGVSERRACKVPGQPRSTQRYEPVAAAYEQELTAAIVEVASQSVCHIRPHSSLD